MKKKVLVVDLDGTLFKINTFHYFLKYLFISFIARFNFVLVFKIGVLVGFRALKIITHSRLKYAVLKLISARKDVNYSKFVDSISLKKRNIEILKDKSFDIKILATAAPSCYANIISEIENFDVCLGTNFPNSNYNSEFENIKEVKKNVLVNYLNINGLTEIDTFVTDHLDDLPIIKLAKRNIIVSPNYELERLLKLNAIAFETIV